MYSDVTIAEREKIHSSNEELVMCLIIIHGMSQKFPNFR